MAGPPMVSCKAADRTNREGRATTSAHARVYEPHTSGRHGPMTGERARSLLAEEDLSQPKPLAWSVVLAILHLYKRYL
jgi:hypothetical protein